MNGGGSLTAILLPDRSLFRATGGRTALQGGKRASPAALLGVGMPTLDGYEVAKRICGRSRANALRQSRRRR
jgi:CheY-like chemotaxis protein